MSRSVWLVGDASPRGTPQTRSERLIAGGRIVLAVVALVAIWIDPDQPRHHVAITYGALAGYLAYATVVAVLVAWAPAAPSWLPLVTQVLDIATSPVLMYLTEGPASPFFLYFLFPILSATLRWHLRGTVWTTGISLAVFLGLGAWAWQTLPDESLDPPRFVIRAAFLGVLAALLGALGAHERALRAQLLRLAHGPRSIALKAEELARDALRQAGILEAPRVVMAWEDGEEPWLNVASCAQGEVTLTREAPSTWEPLVAEPLADGSFLCENLGAPTPLVNRETPAGFEQWRGAPLHPGFCERFGVAVVLSVPLRGAHIQGRLFWLDRPRSTADDLMLGQIVAGQVAPLLDQIVLHQKLRGAAIDQERVRLARDLHDGLLQSLAAAGLQVQAAREGLGTQRDAARDQLAEVQRALAEEQRSLRLFIRQMRPGSSREDERTAPLCERVRGLARRVGREWGLEVRVEDEGMRTLLDPGLEQQVYLMVHEAVMNAARHAGARTVHVELTMVNGRLRLAVEDDGHGFPFEGRRDAEELASAEEGPVSLRERTAALGGALVVDSSRQGARVEIVVPTRTGQA